MKTRFSFVIVSSHLRIVRDTRTSFESRERRSFDSATGCAVRRTVCSCICRIRSHVPNTLSDGCTVYACEGWKASTARAGDARWVKRTDDRTDGRERAGTGNYIDCVAGWQRQWHMSPKLLVIADLNMRQRGPLAELPALCAAAAPYFCSCLRPLLLLLPSVHFSSFFSLSLFFPIRHFLFPARSIDWHCLSEAA